MSTHRPDGSPLTHDELLIDVARRYYFSNESKVEIATTLGLSRFKVARMLEEAVHRGAVRITLHRPTTRASELSVRLKQRYGLNHAVVVPTEQRTEPEVRRLLGDAGARLLTTLLAEGDVLGVSWGRTIKALAEATVSLPRVPVVQLSGIAGNPGENSMELVRILSSITKDDAFPLYTPLLVPDAATARSLRHSPGVAEAFDRFRSVSVAVVAVGSWNPANSQLRTFFSTQDQAALTAMGLQAETGGILLDAEGREIDSPVVERIMGISSVELRAVPTVVAVAGHVTKAKAIRSVLLAGIANALVTDEAVARLLLQEDPLI
ncbi:sugar-binding transcriptional regulator [Georgenia satyanarayanai]|uniref:sugar-binding transcriptional regulator n=1 Tax=Georgenia satyanarayanai TaxID=860221 RepID=UPI0012642ACE|nr:sugar-binding domain-containing protein [Georgenia satyanarayanai]